MNAGAFYFPQHPQMHPNGATHNQENLEGNASGPVSPRPEGEVFFPGPTGFQGDQ